MMLLEGKLNKTEINIFVLKYFCIVCNVFMICVTLYAANNIQLFFERSLNFQVEGCKEFTLLIIGYDNVVQKALQFEWAEYTIEKSSGTIHKNIITVKL